MFSRAKQGLLAISARSKNASDQEKRVAKNVNSALALTLQDLSVDFRKSQSNYLKSTCKPSLSRMNMDSCVRRWMLSGLLLLCCFRNEKQGGACDQW